MKHCVQKIYLIAATGLQHVCNQRSEHTTNRRRSCRWCWSSRWKRRPYSSRKFSFHQVIPYFNLSKYQHCFLTYVNFITEDRMLRNTFKWKQNVYIQSECSIIWGGKKKGNTNSKSLINTRVWGSAWGTRFIKNWSQWTRKCELVLIVMTVPKLCIE